MEPKKKNNRLFLFAGIAVGLICLCLVIAVIVAPKTNTAKTPGTVAAIVATATTVNPAAPTNTPAPTVTPAPLAESDRCVLASDLQTEAIRSGIKSVDVDNDIKIAWAVKSTDFSKVWIVAAKIYGPGMEDGTGPGIWAVSGEMDNPGLTLSVNAFAKEFSPWPDGSKTDAQTSLSTDGVAEAQACAINKATVP